MALKLSEFLIELRRRRVLRVAVIYTVVGVGAIEGLRLLFEAIGLPMIIWYVLAVCILLGFPAALVLGQVLEVTPEEPLHSPSSRMGGTSRTIAVVGLLSAAVAGYFLLR
jgi:hypothetical protein